MGQMIKMTHVGVYIEFKASAEEFNNMISDKDEIWYKKVHEGENSFISAYQGLEEIPVIIPYDLEYNLFPDINQEQSISIEDLESYKTDKINSFAKKYAKEIEDIIKISDFIFFVKFGVVSYWDEIA